MGFNRRDQNTRYFYGPSAFDISGENLVYILDSVHSRIAVFNQNGKMVKTFPVELGWPKVSEFGIDIDESNNVWITDGHNFCIRQYTSEGNLIKSIKYNVGPMRLIESDIIIRSGEIFLPTTKIKVNTKSTGTGNSGEPLYEATKISLNKDKQPRLIGKISNRIYGSPYIKKGTEKILITEKNGEKNEIILHGIDAPHLAVFQDEDMHGNIFIEIGYPASKKPRQIWKYSPDLELLAKIENYDVYPRTFYTFNLGKDWVIDDTGNIYIMRTYEKGVQIIKWSLVKNRD